MKIKSLSLIFLCLSFVALPGILSGCSLSEPVIFHANAEPNSFPATVNIEYYNSDHSPLSGKNVLITFRYEPGSRYGNKYYNAYPVVKTKEGYKVINSDYEHYAVPDPTKFGFSKVYALQSKNGHFDMTFNSKDEYQDFVNHVSLGDASFYFKSHH